MSIPRVTLIAFVWALLVAVCAFMVNDLATFLDLRTGLFVLAFPLLASAVAHGPTEPLAAVADGFRARADDLPSERRSASASILRGLGALSFTAGLVVFLGSIVSVFNAIAMSGGQAQVENMFSSLGTMTLAPVYGLALKTFLYDLLAGGLENPTAGLGVELAGEDE